MKPLALMSDAERALLMERVLVAVEGQIPKGCAFAVVVIEGESGRALVTSNVGLDTAWLLREGAAVIERPGPAPVRHVKGRN
jgi:hypothetical protein